MTCVQNVQNIENQLAAAEVEICQGRRYIKAAQTSLDDSILKIRENSLLYFNCIFRLYNSIIMVNLYLYKFKFKW